MMRRIGDLSSNAWGARFRLPVARKDTCSTLRALIASINRDEEKTIASRNRQTGVDSGPHACDARALIFRSFLLGQGEERGDLEGVCSSRFCQRIDDEKHQNECSREHLFFLVKLNYAIFVRTTGHRIASEFACDMHLRHRAMRWKQKGDDKWIERGASAQRALTLCRFGTFFFELADHRRRTAMSLTPSINS